MFTDRSDEPLSHKTESFAPARVQPHTPWLLRSQWQLWSVLLPLGILLYLIQTQVSVRLEKQAVSQNTLAAQLVAQAVQERFGNLKNNMKNLSRVRILTEAAANQNTETAREVLKQFIANNATGIKSSVAVSLLGETVEARRGGEDGDSGSSRIAG